MKPILILFSLFLLVGCGEVKYSEPMFEDAVIDDVIFAPSQHGSGPTTTINAGGGVGVGVTSISIPEKFAVVFKCAHGKFIVQGTGEKYKALWERFSRGDSVNVIYREGYKNGTLVELDFLDAKKR